MKDDNETETKIRADVLALQGLRQHQQAHLRFVSGLVM